MCNPFTTPGPLHWPVPEPRTLFPQFSGLGRGERGVNLENSAGSEDIQRDPGREGALRARPPFVPSIRPPRRGPSLPTFVPQGESSDTESTFGVLGTVRVMRGQTPELRLPAPTDRCASASWRVRRLTRLNFGVVLAGVFQPPWPSNCPLLL